MLLNLARGSAVKGAAGIPPVRGFFVRPLLEVSREEVLDYLERKELPYRTDSTNLDCNYTRNAIRWEVLPALERARPGAVQALARFAANMEQLSEYLSQQVGKLLCEARLSGAEYDAEIMRAAPSVVCLSLIHI